MLFEKRALIDLLPLKVPRAAASCVILKFSSSTLIYLMDIMQGLSDQTVLRLKKPFFIQALTCIDQKKLSQWHKSYMYYLNYSCCHLHSDLVQFKKERKNKSHMISILVQHLKQCSYLSYCQSQTNSLDQ